MDNKVLEILESKEWKDFYNYYLDIGIIEQIGLFRYEDIHTNFLASLLKKDNIYGYGLKSMKQLLKFIKENQRQDKKNNEDYFEGINLSEDYDIIDFSEPDIRKKIGKYIPDLYITFGIKQGNIKKYFIILIEAKLESPEHSNQTKTYYEKLEGNKELKKYRKIYIYLTLDGKKGKDCSYKNTYELYSYQDLIDNLYSELSSKNTRKVPLKIEDYLITFNILYRDGIYNIPVTEESAKLTRNLFKKIENNLKDDLNYYIQEIYNSSSNNEWHKEIIRVFFSNIKYLNRKNDSFFKDKDTSFINNYVKRGNEINRIDNKRYNNSEYIYQVFKKIIKDYKVTYKDLENINKGKNNYQYIYTEEEFNNIKNYKDCYTIDKYGNLKIGDKKYYYLYRTNSEEIKLLIENIKNDDKFIKYKQENTFEILEQLENK